MFEDYIPVAVTTSARCSSGGVCLHFCLTLNKRSSRSEELELASSEPAGDNKNKKVQVECMKVDEKLKTTKHAHFKKFAT